MKYNRLELVLLADSEYNHLDYQPLFNDYKLYSVGGSSIISYGRKPSQATKKEIINKVITNEIFMYSEYGEFTFMGNSLYNKLYTFSFFHIKRGFEHEAIKICQNSSLITPDEECENWGVSEENIISNPRQTKKIIKILNDEKYIEDLEHLAKAKFEQPNLNTMFHGFFIERIIDKVFGERYQTKEEVISRYKELVKIHHPDKGGDELIFKAVVSAKKYLIAKFENNSNATKTKRIK